jgi:hypothetical protein
LAINDVVYPVPHVVCRISETITITGPLGRTDTTTKNNGIMETAEKKKMTASEKRFAHEMRVLLSMSLGDLMKVEKTRMSVGV